MSANSKRQRAYYDIAWKHYQAYMEEQDSLLEKALDDADKEWEATEGQAEKAYQKDVDEFNSKRYSQRLTQLSLDKAEALKDKNAKDKLASQAYRDYKRHVIKHLAYRQIVDESNAAVRKYNQLKKEEASLQREYKNARRTLQQNKVKYVKTRQAKYANRKREAQRTHMNNRKKAFSTYGKQVTYIAMKGKLPPELQPKVKAGQNQGPALLGPFEVMVTSWKLKHGRWSHAKTGTWPNWVDRIVIDHQDPAEFRMYGYFENNASYEVVFNGQKVTMTPHRFNNGQDGHRWVAPKKQQKLLAV